MATSCGNATEVRAKAIARSDRGMPARKDKPREGTLLAGKDEEGSGQQSTIFECIWLGGAETSQSNNSNGDRGSERQSWLSLSKGYYGPERGSYLMKSRRPEPDRERHSPETSRWQEGPK